MRRLKVHESSGGRLRFSRVLTLRLSRKRRPTSCKMRFAAAPLLEMRKCAHSKSALTTGSNPFDLMPRRRVLHYPLGTNCWGRRMPPIVERRSKATSVALRYPMTSSKISTNYSGSTTRSDLRQHQPATSREKASRPPSEPLRKRRLRLILLRGKVPGLRRRLLGFLPSNRH